MNREKLGLNIVCSVLLVLGWGIILFVTFLLLLISDVFSMLGNGMLIYIVAGIYALAFILPIIFRKKLSEYFTLPLWFVVFSLFSVALAAFVLLGAKSYISSYSAAKWSDNANLRFYMIDDLEEKHKINGLTKEEITELIGEPEYIYDEEDTYEYFIGVNMIDMVGYQIKFENGIAKETRIVEH